MKPVLGNARYLVMIAVVGALIAAVCLMVYGFLEGGKLVFSLIEKAEVTRKGAKEMALEFIEIIDLFLMETVFYIISVGLYSLFINTDVRLPEWLKIRTLDDLKNKLLSVVIVVLAVVFLGQAVAWDGARDLMGLGIGIAAVIAALTWFISVKAGNKGE
jgi:uncharacterized membrane protein YqhA